MNFLTKLFKGRINRRDFLNKFLLILLINVFASLLLQLILPDKIESFVNLDFFSLKGFLILLINIVAVTYSYTLIIKRLHDLGKPEGFSIIYILALLNINGTVANSLFGNLVGLINFVFIIYLFFAKGNKSKNEYGAPPAPYQENNMLSYKIIKYIIAGITVCISLAVLFFLGVIIYRSLVLHNLN